jgi:hypothetical protein
LREVPVRVCRIRSREGFAGIGKSFAKIGLFHVDLLPAINALGRQSLEKNLHFWGILHPLNELIPILSPIFATRGYFRESGEPRIAARKQNEPNTGLM